MGVSTEIKEDFSLQKWFAKKHVGKVILEHSGDFTSEYIDSVLPKIEEGLIQCIEFENVRKKAFHIFVECIQNLYHHVEPIEGLEKKYESNRIGAIVLSKDGSFCRISTGNFIRKEKQAKLIERIEHLNSLTESQVKSLYRDTINNQKFSDKGGAGIGMIDMARKTGNKLQYQFYNVNDNADLLFFSFDVCIS